MNNMLNQRIQNIIQLFEGKENTYENQAKLTEAIRSALAKANFKVICDETNNNEQTAKENRIICDIEFYE